MSKMKLLSAFQLETQKVNILALTAGSKSKIRLTSYFWIFFKYLSNHSELEKNETNKIFC